MRMRLNMMLGSFVGVMVRLEAVAMGDVGVMAREVMLALFVALGGFAMMLGGLFVMVGSGLMMLGFAQSAHFLLPRDAAEAAIEACRAKMPKR
jgi:hypothetical protein